MAPASLPSNNCEATSRRKGPSNMKPPMKHLGNRFYSVARHKVADRLVASHRVKRNPLFFALGQIASRLRNSIARRDLL